MYNKIFTKILDSSIWLETNPTRIVWMTFLASMDETGYAHFAALGNLAGRARVTLEEAEAAVKVLEAPDRESSDPSNDGRRIERTPGGWMVLNAEKYRLLVTRAVIQEQTRLRVARFREKTRGNAPVTQGNEKLTPSEALAGSEAESKPIPSPAATDAEIVYALYPRKVGKPAALVRIKEALKRNSLTTLCEAVAAYTKAVEGWPDDRKQFIPHPSRWFKEGRFDDDRSTWIHIPKDTTVAWQRPATTPEEYAKGF